MPGVTSGIIWRKVRIKGGGSGGLILRQKKGKRKGEWSEGLQQRARASQYAGYSDRESSNRGKRRPKVQSE